MQLVLYPYIANCVSEQFRIEPFGRDPLAKLFDSIFYFVNQDQTTLPKNQNKLLTFDWFKLDSVGKFSCSPQLNTA